MTLAAPPRPARYAEAEAGADGDVLVVAADGDGEVVAEADVDGDGVGEGVGETEGDELADADAVGDVDECTDGEADVLADGDVPWSGDALAEADACGEAGALEAVRPADADAAGEEVRAAWDGTGVGVCPVKALTAKAAATDAPITPPMIHASTRGRHERRRRLFPPPGAGGGFLPPGGSAPLGGYVLLGSSGMLFEVAVGELSTGARSWLSQVVPWAAEPAAVVCVAPPYPGASSRANARMIDSGSQFAVGWRAPTWASRPSAVGR